MPRKEFIDLVQEIKRTGNGVEMTKRDFIYLFDFCEKRTSGNVWRINEYLKQEKLTVEPDYENGWIDECIEIKPKEKAKIKKNNDNNLSLNEEFDPVNRLSLLEVASKVPISVKRDATLEQAFTIMWKYEYSQLPIMNNDRDVIGIITWQSIAKKLITKKPYTSVNDFISNEFTILDESTPIFDAIKEVIRIGVVFIKDKDKKIKGPLTTSDLNEQFIEQIEPYILLEEIENSLRLILHNKIVLEELNELVKINEKDNRNITSLGDLTFGDYISIMQNKEMWNLLKLPFDRVDFEKDLHSIKDIRNGVMHFHPDGISTNKLEILRKMSKFLKDFRMNC